MCTTILRLFTNRASILELCTYKTHLVQVDNNTQEYELKLFFLNIKVWINHIQFNQSKQANNYKTLTGFTAEYNWYINGLLWSAPPW